MNTDPSPPIPSIADILTQARWKHALFTTYALSLSYFESEVLRPLLQAGCDDIWLVADAEGYRASLLERQSMRIGHEYRLVPAALPNGVFHAKCIYLSSDDGDLLLVGSGNVTFGGHGRNAEVFEVLSPDESTAFRDFAQFLTAIRERADIQIAQRDWIDDFAGRAESAAASGSALTDQPARLLHSLTNPIAEQLQPSLAPFGSCSRAVIMSPYHDPDGKAVKSLAQRLDVPLIEIAVTEEKSSPFPFHLTESWNQKVLPVRPRRSDKRFVHAKWYEFDTAVGRVLLTGSVNATHKALETTDNVELAVLRRIEPGADTLQWDQSEAPSFAPATRMPAGLGSQEIVYASFDRSEPGALHGKLISLQECAGAWSGRIAHTDGQHETFIADVDRSGTFHSRSPEFERLSELPALQITLTKDERVARGWVHNDMYLSMSRRRRLTAGALSRLMRREATDDDLEALLEYLAVSAHQHIRTFSLSFRSAQGEDNAPARNTDMVRVAIDEIAPVDMPRSGAGVIPGGAGESPDHFDVAIGRLRRILLGHGKEKSQLASADGSTAVVGEDADESGRQSESLPEETIHRLGLERFESEITRLLRELGDNSGATRALLSMLLEVGVWMRLYRLNAPDLAYEFVQSWLYRACETALAGEKIEALEQHVVTAVAVTYALSSVMAEHRAQGLALHDALERFYGGAVDAQRAERALIADRHIGVAQLLSAEDTPADLGEALRAVLSQPTRRQQLLDALALAEAGEPVPSDWDVFMTDVGKALHDALTRPGWPRRIRRAPPGFEGCAFEFFAFPNDVKRKFRNERIGRCIHCGRFTLRLDP